MPPCPLDRCAENYRQVLGDCADALTLNPLSIKALYRAASALVAMEKYTEAIDCSSRGLSIPGEEGNVALKEIVRKASGLKEKKDRVEGTRKERARRVAEGKQALQLAFAVGHSSSSRCLDAQNSDLFESVGSLVR